MQMSITKTKGHETKKANYPKTNTIHETGPRTGPRAHQSLENFFAGMFIPFDLPTGISEVWNAEMKISVSFTMVSRLLDKLYNAYTNPNQMRKTRKKQTFWFCRLETLKFITRPYNNVTKKINLFHIVPGPAVQSTINFIHDWRAILFQFCNFSVAF